MIQIALVGKISGADEVVVVPGNDKEWTLVRFGLDVERARGGAGKSGDNDVTSFCSADLTEARGFPEADVTAEST